MNLAGAAIGVAIAAIVIASVTIPILSNVNTTGWSTTDTTIFGYVSTFLLLGLLVGAIAGAGVYMYSR